MPPPNNKPISGKCNPVALPFINLHVIRGVNITSGIRYCATVPQPPVKPPLSRAL